MRLVEGALVALGMLLFAARPAHAQERAPAPIDVVCAGASAPIDALESVLRDLLPDAPMRVTRSAGTADVVLQRGGGVEPRAAVRVWIDLRGPERAVVVLVDERAERVVVRSVPLATATADRARHADEVVLEEVAHIVSTSVRAILAGQPLGVSRESARRELGLAPPAGAPVAPAPVAPAATAASIVPRPTSTLQRATAQGGAPTSTVSLRVTLGYEPRLYAGDALTHGAQLSVDVGATSGRWRFGGRLEGLARGRLRRAGEPLGVVLDPFGARLFGSVGWQASRLLTLDFAAGATLELVRARPTRGALGGASLVLGEPRTRVDLLASGVVGVSLWLHPRVALGVRLGLDIDPSNGRYVWLRDGQPVVVFAPSPLRPYLLVYVGGDLPL